MEDGGALDENSRWILLTTLHGRVNHCFQLLDGETEAQRNKAATLRSHSKTCPRWDSNPGPLTLNLCPSYLGTHCVSLSPRAPEPSRSPQLPSLVAITMKHSVLISYGCCDKEQQTWWFKTTHIILGGQKPDVDLAGLKLRCRQGWLLLEAPGFQLLKATFILWLTAPAFSFFKASSG